MKTEDDRWAEAVSWEAMLPDDGVIRVEPDILTFALLEEELLSEGYQQGAPAGAYADRDIVERGRCTTCGGSMTFVPFTRWDAFNYERSYRAFVVCRTCDSASEF